MKKINANQQFDLRKIYSLLRSQLSILLSISTVLYASASAAAVFQTCSASDLKNIHAKLTAISLANSFAKNAAPTEQPSFFDCIHLQKNHAILTLSSHPTGTSQDNAGNYNLSFSLWHPTTFQILNQFQAPQQIIPSTRLDDIKFDINPYSAQQDLVGIALYQSHIGGINSSKRLLNLYSINAKQQIRPVLNQLLTNYQSSTSNNKCGEWHTVEMKRSIHLTGKIKNNFPIFKIKEQSKETNFNYTSCRAEITKTQNNYQIQLNGTHYFIQHLQLNDPDL